MFVVKSIGRARIVKGGGLGGCCGNFVDMRPRNLLDSKHYYRDQKFENSL